MKYIYIKKGNALRIRKNLEATLLFVCLFLWFIKLKSRLWYFSLAGKMKKCFRPECGKEQFSNMKTLPFLQIFYSYLQMPLLYMVFPAGWRWGSKHTSQSGGLPSCCLSYPNLQIPCRARFWTAWVPQAETKSGPWLESCSWKTWLW